MLFSQYSKGSARRPAPSYQFILGLVAILLFVTLLEAGHHHSEDASQVDNCALCAHNLSVEKIVPLGNWVAPQSSVALLNVVARYENLASACHSFFSIRAPPAKF